MHITREGKRTLAEEIANDYLEGNIKLFAIRSDNLYEQFEDSTANDIVRRAMDFIIDQKIKEELEEAEEKDNNKAEEM
ncbi:hypothetical protein P4679_25925 [Priestia megaterium]|uniref:hypothetical protein n=1 Tax=Priestia megaterium TaxID=1404 RepID=UPI002E20B85E|nr:hypothetical protein [Priestia megaterium]